MSSLCRKAPLIFIIGYKYARLPYSFIFLGGIIKGESSSICGDHSADECCRWNNGFFACLRKHYA